MNKQKIKQAWNEFLKDDKQYLVSWVNGYVMLDEEPTTEAKLKITKHRLLNLMDAVNQIVEEITAEVDPCPGCFKGGVCRTFKCGRLKLPTDHPLRNQP